METYQFRYIGVGHSEARCGYVLINLERQEGTQFGVCLSVDDANQLLDDLPEQVRIATQNSN